MDKILEQFGLKYDDLNSEEKKTLSGWMESLSKNELTIDIIRNYIFSMKESVEQELTKTDLNTKQDIFLKARLRNYMLLEAFLTTPEKAKKAIEQAISGFKVNKT